MNVDELRQRLMVDPDDQDPEVEAAKNETLEHRRVARECERFEARLKAALQASADAATVDSVERALPARHSGRRSWMAIAASVAAAALMVLILADPLAADSTRAALVEHFQHNEPGALESDQPVDLAQAIDLLAEVDAHPAESMVLTYARRCIIGGEQGLHLVLTGPDNGKTSVLFIPTQARVREGDIDVAGARARLVDVSQGAVGVFVHGSQSVNDTVDALFASSQAISFVSAR